MKKNLSRAAAAVALSAALLSLAGCQTAAKNAVQELEAQDAVTIQLVCQSEDVYQIFYSTYLEGEAYGQGGWADLDGKALTPETSLTASFDKEYFEGKDISTLSMDFSPYGEGDTVELATTEQVAIPAEYGETYTILFTGDEENGFTAQLQPEPSCCIFTGLHTKGESRSGNCAGAAFLLLLINLRGFPLAAEKQSHRQQRHQTLRHREGQPNAHHLPHSGQ